MLVTEGYVTPADGVRLFFQKVGDGRSTVVVPNAVYMFDDFVQARGVATAFRLSFSEPIIRSAIPWTTLWCVREPMRSRELVEAFDPSEYLNSFPGT